MMIIPIFFLTFILFSQVKQHEVAVTDVGVQVRVLDGDRFVNDLKIEDFELNEEDKPQKIEALYLVKRTNIERKEELANFNPKLSRNFYFLFQILDYNPKFDEAIDYFFNQIFLPSDTLSIWTPREKYNLSADALRKIPKEKIAKEMKNIVMKDTKIGSAHYNDVMRELRRLAISISNAAGFGQEANPTADIESESLNEGLSIEELLLKYRQSMGELDNLRIVDEKMFLNFAEAMKRKEGENYVLFFCQKEFKPEINSRILNQMIGLYQDNPSVLGSLQDLFESYHRNIQFDRNRIKQAFSDSSFVFNFIFMNKVPENISGINMKDQSEDTFSVLSEAAKATGGIVDTSQNPAHGFKSALDASETYYLLYYSPADYVKDGKFKSIKISLKNKDYKVIHRLGYYAN
jgi:hypothetical protein